jgi:serine/threonine protein kinase
MAPEQYRGHADVQSDLFSYCAALFEALYRERPFAGQTLSERMSPQRKHALRLPPQTDVPPAIFKLLERGLEPDRARRFAAMGEPLPALEAQAGPTASSTMRTSGTCRPREST